MLSTYLSFLIAGMAGAGMLFSITADLLFWKFCSPYFDAILKQHNIPFPREPMIYAGSASYRRAQSYEYLIGQYTVLHRHYRQFRLPYYKYLFQGFDFYRYIRKQDKILASVSLLFTLIYLISMAVGIVGMYFGWLFS